MITSTLLSWFKYLSGPGCHQGCHHATLLCPRHMLRQASAKCSQEHDWRMLYSPSIGTASLGSCFQEHGRGGCCVSGYRDRQAGSS